ncbi:response regulator [Niabella sp. W65]|nr:response regulator [Niabella sp. W65]MCH7362980.1 response regulator [Niabella sp. W65]
MSKVILIVEDEPDLMEVICLILALDEYVLVPCATVRAFKQELEKQFPDLIILDVRLPDGNGIDICNEMKGHNDFKATPIMLMSAHLDSKNYLKTVLMFSLKNHFLLTTFVRECACCLPVNWFSIDKTW